ncbi:MAG: hypothetical protein RLZZ440_231 [Planctomycetota bacterium]
MTAAPRLEAAYRATSYMVLSVTGRPEFMIRCGTPSPEVDRLLAGRAFDGWAFITACNPRSQILPEAENAARMARLEAALRDRGHGWLPGSGQGDAGDWPAEPSLLVLGIPEVEAVAIAAAFDQHAILVGRRGEPARLVWTAAPRK